MSLLAGLHIVEGL
jgi:hypothetical protein